MVGLLRQPFFYAERDGAGFIDHFITIAARRNQIKVDPA